MYFIIQNAGTVTGLAMSLQGSLQGVPRAIFPQDICRLRVRKKFSRARLRASGKNFLECFLFAERKFVCSPMHFKT